jgi:hypothetical protein
VQHIITIRMRNTLQFIPPEVTRILKLTSAWILLQTSLKFSFSEVDPHVEIILLLPNAQATITDAVFRFHFYYRLAPPFHQMF